MEEETNVTHEETSEVRVESGQKKPSLLGVGVVLALVILVVPMLLSGKKKQGEIDTAKTEVTVAPQVALPTAATPVDVVNSAIAIEAGSFYFKPNLIRVKKGEKVKLTLNSVSMMHDFNIDELGIRIPVTKSGNSGTVEFTANKVGEFEFYCSVGEHRQLGQVGKLIVVE